MNRTAFRIGLFFIVSALVVTLPWWLSVIILFGLTVYLPLYIEVLFFGFIFDTLYSVNFGLPHAGLWITLGFFLIVYFIRINIRT